MFKVGEAVQVVKINDADPPIWDEMARKRYWGKCGKVVKIWTAGHCGESPQDPMYLVAFGRGTTRDAFWPEELQRKEK